MPEWGMESLRIMGWGLLVVESSSAAAVAAADPRRDQRLLAPAAAGTSSAASSMQVNQARRAVRGRKISKQKNLEMPIAEAVNKVIAGDLRADEAVKNLMLRDSKSEIA